MYVLVLMNLFSSQQPFGHNALERKVSDRPEMGVFLLPKSRSNPGVLRVGRVKNV